jgi:anti-sigma factor RsiW
MAAMTGNVVPFDPAVHKVVDALLPWYVNGTLEPGEHAMVEQHLAHCIRCRGEIEWLRELCNACVKVDSDSGSSTAFAKLRRHLDERSPAQGATGHSTTPARTTPWLRWALATQFAVIAVLAVALLRDAQPPAVYRTLAAPEMSAARKGALVIVFDPGTTEPAMRRVLRSAGASIVSGPTPQGAYILDVPDSRVEQARQALRNEHAVVLVEPLTDATAN